MYIQTQYKQMKEGSKLISKLESDNLITNVNQDMYDPFTLEFKFDIVSGNENTVKSIIKKNSNLIKY